MSPGLGHEILRRFDLADATGIPEELNETIERKQELSREGLRPLLSGMDSSIHDAVDDNMQSALRGIEEQVTKLVREMDAGQRRIRLPLSDAEYRSPRGHFRDPRSVRAADGRKGGRTACAGTGRHRPREQAGLARPLQHP
jgi:hypothetical protein